MALALVIVLYPDNPANSLFWTARLSYFFLSASRIFPSVPAIFFLI
jgi:hypothetical protein